MLNLFRRLFSMLGYIPVSYYCFFLFAPDIRYEYTLHCLYCFISCELLRQICVDIFKNCDMFRYNFIMYELLDENSNKVCLK